MYIDVQHPLIYISGTLRKLLTIKADLTNIAEVHKSSEPGKQYWSTAYAIKMKFGGPELAIYAAWYEGVSTIFLGVYNLVLIIVHTQDVERQ